MIFKKPYAFFIKNFKFFHLIIFVLSAILLYRTTLIYDFMKEYAKLTPHILGKDVTSTLFVSWSYILITIIIIVNILLIIILKRKEKPILYYVINIGLYIGILIIYIASNRVINDIETMLVETKTTLAIRDFLNLARLFQTVSVIFYLVRATGFDIKKFDFVRDLHKLNISEEDSEEIEVAVEFEKNEIIRDIKKKIRNARYYYKENRFILNIIILLAISAILLIIYVNTNKYSKIYKENDFFNVNNINIGVKESNIITKDYKGKTLNLNNDILVTVKISLNSDENQALETSRAQLSVNGKLYYHVKEYEKKLIDLGNVYTNQIITENFNDYLLVYQIPKEEINSEIYLKYIDNLEYKRGETKTNALTVKLEPKKIDEEKLETKTYNIGEEIDTNSSISDYKILINNFEINNEYTDTYNSCIALNECYDFKEIIKPTVTTEQEKTILKLDGQLNYEKPFVKIIDLYSLINEFGSIEYKIDGKQYIETSDFNEIKALKTFKPNIYYIEVNKNLEQATEIKLSITIRNKKYTYILKGENQ